MGIANTLSRYRVQLRVANSIHEHTVLARSAEQAIWLMRERVARDGWSSEHFGQAYAENIADAHDYSGKSLFRG